MTSSDNSTVNSNRPKKIGLLGGSFNPAHNGHREISLAALDTIELDEIWWLVTPGNPLKNANDYAAYDVRRARAFVIASHPKIRIVDFEKEHDLQYTIDTLRALTKTYPSHQFVWVIGADNLAQFDRWKDWRQIFEKLPICVVSRPGYEDDALTGSAAKAFAKFRINMNSARTLADATAPAWVYIDGIHNTLSSTQLRMDDMKKNLTAPHGHLSYFLDLHPNLGDFREDVIAGLTASPKSLSPKYFYDEAGSNLFSQITEAPEYYPTRTERAIFEKHGDAITRSIGANVGVFEYGSGASEKIDWLLTGLSTPAGYVAMDISREYLIDNASQIAEKYALPVAAICADFHDNIIIPGDVEPIPDHWLGFFPGSTLGNMSEANAVALLNRASKTLGANAQFLLGIDLEKDIDVLNAAYNDAAGITEQFNLNLLTRMQRELNAELTISDFEHFAFYNEDMMRIEMHLRALHSTTISIGEHAFAFEAGESLHTENSHKYSINRLERIFAQTPWRLENVWQDDKNWFAACLLRNN